MSLNANAKEWRPTGDLVPFTLPTSTSDKASSVVAGHDAITTTIANTTTNTMTSNSAATGKSWTQEEEHEHQQEQQQILHSLDSVTESPAYYPSFTLAGPSTMLADNNNNIDSSGAAAAVVAVELQGVNWTEEFERVMTLTKVLIERQMSSEKDPANKMDLSGYVAHHGKTKHNPTVEHTPLRKLQGGVVSMDPSRYPSLPGTDEVRPLVSGKWVNAPMTSMMARSIARGGGEAHGGNTGPVTTAASSHMCSGTEVIELDENGRPLPPLTSKGNRRWKKPTKAQQKREMAQKNAFEAFANALLHSVSPFMVPLRERCKTSLPHIKVDQRFGKSGQPQTAVAQFVVAPLVTNYRPRHFHDLTPGDLMEFHYDFAQVLKQLKSASDIIFGYGPVWKRYAVPYCYVSCKEYRQEVLNLCPDEVPNMRVEPIYEDDIVKDIMDVVLAIDELEPLQNISFAQAMSRRINLAPLFDAFDTIFKPVENYRIVIRDLHRAPSTYLIQTSQHEIEQKPSPLVLYNDPTLWYKLPMVSRIKVEEKTPLDDSQLYSVEKATTSHSSVQRKKEANTGSTSTNGHSVSAKQGSRGKRSNASDASSLALMAPVLGSVGCLLVTCCILWRRKSHS